MSLCLSWTEHVAYLGLPLPLDLPFPFPSLPLLPLLPLLPPAPGGGPRPGLSTSSFFASSNFILLSYLMLAFLRVFWRILAARFPALTSPEETIQRQGADKATPKLT